MFCENPLINCVFQIQVQFVEEAGVDLVVVVEVVEVVDEEVRDVKFPFFHRTFHFFVY